MSESLKVLDANTVHLELRVNGELQQGEDDIRSELDAIPNAVPGE